MIPKRKGAIYKSDTLCDESNDSKNGGDEPEQSDKLEQVEKKMEDEHGVDKVSENDDISDRNERATESKVENIDISKQEGFHEQYKEMDSSSACGKVTCDKTASQDQAKS